MEAVVRGLRILYIVAAFGGSLAMRIGGGMAYAQAAQEPSFTQSIPLEDEGNRRDRTEEALAVRVDQLDERVSTIQGIGSGALGVLGVLQLMGLIASAKARRGQAGDVQ
jgi:hypothetical protein